VGFAVPVNSVKRVVPSLIATGRYAHPWLGIEGRSITPLVAQQLNLPVERGVMIQGVVEDGPADKAALRGSNRQVNADGALVSTGGDIIVAMDGREVRHMDDLVVHLADKKVGQRVTLTILRSGAERRTQVALEERPAR